MGTHQIHKPPVGMLPAGAFSALALVLILNILTPATRADDEAGQPARAIRLSYVDGRVQLSKGDQPVAEQAVINTPLLEGMMLTTADDGKAEIQFEDGSVARVAPNSALTLTTLAGSGASSVADLTLERGEAYFELQGKGQVGPMHVQFGDSVVDASGFTVLRVQYDTPPGTVAVFSGNAHLERGNSIFLDLRGGESLAFNNSSGGYNLTESIASDSWDTWNSDRDQALNAEAAAQTNAPSDLAQGNASNPAWSDLDASGSWYNVPNQGYVWSPYEAANASFDPYGMGSWVWMPGFGYTWASGYSWGYLPFSCGAWNYYDTFGWGWAPGFGGCSPWWNIGFYGGPIIGFAPGWYRPVHRPEPPRERPWRGHPVPMIAVNRHEPGIGTPLPPRDRNTPVNIGGATVVGMRPMPGRGTPRPGVVVHGLTGGNQAGGFNNRPVYVTPRNAYNPPSGGYTGPQPGRPNGVEPQRPGTFNPAPQPGRIYGPPMNRGNVTPSVPVSPPAAPGPSAPRTYTPPSAPSSPQPSRPSGGGNPGGGFHPSPAPSPGPGAGSGGGFHGGGSPGGGNSGGGSGSHPGGSGGGHR